MDPNETLRRLRELAIKAIKVEDSEAFAREQKDAILCELATEQAELFQALDQWLTRRGFPPSAWNHRPEPTSVETDG